MWHFAAFVNCNQEKNECMKKGMMCKFMEETVPKFCEQMTCLLKKNGGKYFVGDCVSIIWQISLVSYTSKAYGITKHTGERRK